MANPNPNKFSQFIRRVIANNFVIAWTMWTGNFHLKHKITPPYPCMWYWLVWHSLFVFSSIMSTQGLVQLLRNDAGLLQMFVDTYIDTNGKWLLLTSEISKTNTPESLLFIAQPRIHLKSTSFNYTPGFQ